MKSIICDFVFIFLLKWMWIMPSLHLKMLVRTGVNTHLSSLKECGHRSDWKFQLVGMFYLLFQQFPNHSITSLSYTILSHVNSVYSEPK